MPSSDILVRPEWVMSPLSRSDSTYPGYTDHALLRHPQAARWPRRLRSTDVQSAFAHPSHPSHPLSAARYAQHRCIQAEPVSTLSFLDQPFQRQAVSHGGCSTTSPASAVVPSHHLDDARDAQPRARASHGSRDKSTDSDVFRTESMSRYALARSFGAFGVVNTYRVGLWHRFRREWVEKPPADWASAAQIRAASLAAGNCATSWDLTSTV